MVMFHKISRSYFNMKHLRREIFGRSTPSKRGIANNKPAVILGIETSCDETGVAIVNSNGIILGDALHSQQSFHMDNGGIILPLARELHKKYITDVCEEALKSANLRLRDVDAIAVTVKPGLAFSLLVGMYFAKYLSKIGNKPLIPIHHMEAHALTARIVEKVEFPYLALLISGGHCLLAIVENVDRFYLLGTSIDNFPGETFDKVARRAKLRNIPEFYNMSGGMSIEHAAKYATDLDQFKFEATLTNYRDCNFSFSGLKNRATRYIILEERKHNIVGDMVIPDVYNLCAAFQMAVMKHLCHRTQRAMEYIERNELIPEANRTLVVSGGVACNNYIARALSCLSSEMGYKFVRPPPKLCTDNGVMIAWNGVERWLANVGVITNQDEINKVHIQGCCPLGEDWTKKVSDMNIKCQWIKVWKHWQD